jgi:putative proteasome-type protease
MTYCVGILMDEGFVVASDRRTNAGVDHVASVMKMNIFERPGDRVVALLSAGNLAITQAVVAILQERHRAEKQVGTVFAAPNMFRAARAVGEAMREVYRTNGDDLRRHGIDLSASFIVGGQVRGEPPRLFLIYSAGNFIEATSDTPYFQNGETKYGKPVLDRLAHDKMTLAEATKCAIVSYTATMRSNLSVGLPIDLLAYRKDSLRVETRVTIDQDDPYFNAVRDQWSADLQRVFEDLPNPEYAGGEIRIAGAPPA